jgi:hypothetical protein
MGSSTTFEVLSKQLLHRRSEIWRAVLARAQQVAAGPTDADTAYREGMRAAALAAVDYGRDVIERRDADLPAVPSALLAQARLAAASGVSLDSVVRRYFGGYAMFSAAVVEEAHKSALSSEAVQYVMRRQAEAFDHLISEVTREYAEESKQRSNLPENLRLKLVSALLAGAHIDSRELGYELGQRHIGLVTSASGAKAFIVDLARQIDRQILVAQRSEHEIWAWLGGRSPLSRVDLERVLARLWPKAHPLALGEDCQGRAGWRLTHRQALRSWPAAVESPIGIVWYRHVALSSAILQDKDLVAFLRQFYLVPLLGEPGGMGSPLCETLRTYFSTGGNVSSTASALAVSRQTVTNRLRQAEARLGDQISHCRVELECALRLDAQHIGSIGADRAA